MKRYFRPIPQSDLHRPADALTLAGGWTWFDRIEVLTREGAELIAAKEAPSDVLQRLTDPRANIAGLPMERPTIMGILNVTPDSFSDGGDHNAPDRAVAHARQMVAQGADLIDVGGESTRPGATLVPDDQEIARTAPVIAAIRVEMDVPISIDTRKAAVAKATVQAGADIVNDVSGFTFDTDLAGYCASAKVPVMVMHAQGDPQTMQDAPCYDDVLLDVFDFLEERVEALVAAGIPRGQIIVDPGIGFGKTLQHNLLLLNRLSLFHSLGCAILLGVSRKRFIGTIGKAPEPKYRAAGSVSVGLRAVMDGVQMLRVHDVAETRSALDLWMAVHRAEYNE
ncbi:dihydropteroate synthase [Thalassovita sp.]|jgi:dihydropteroate synthase|uniref:dihydropteroate synthase n=1 Tax=Thalassovita sp. TaxID=1979401 RepID=UPI003B5A325F